MRANILALSALVLISVLGADLFAQSQPTSETLRIAAGDTFEIGIDGPATSDFSWVLTKDRAFLGAERNRFYQTRFRDPGTYQLDVSVRDTVSDFNLYRAFTIVVSDPLPITTTPERDRTKAPKAVAITDPATSTDGVHLGKQGGIVKIDPGKSEGNVSAFFLDIDNNIDTDGNGNPADDDDTIGTSFAIVGSPMYIATLPSSAPRSITLSVDDQSQTEDDLVLPLIFDGAVIRGSGGSGSTIGLSPDGLVPTAGTIIQADINGLEVRFTPILPESAKDKQVVAFWNFGDRSVSLLTTPVHTYRSGGSYIVTLRVQDIANGEVLLAGSNSIELVSTTPPPSESSSSASSIHSSQASSEPDTSSDSSGIRWGSLMKVLLIVLFLLAIALGLYALFVWIKNKAAGRLHETFEKMEKTIVTQEGVASGTVEPAPMKLARAASAAPLQEVRSEPEGSEREFLTERRSLETPVESTGPVPSWLASAAPPTPESRPSEAPSEVFPETPSQSTVSQPTAQASEPQPAPVPQPEPEAPAPIAEPAPSPEPVAALEPTVQPNPEPIPQAPLETESPSTPPPTITTEPASEPTPEPPAEPPSPPIVSEAVSETSQTPTLNPEQTQPSAPSAGIDLASPPQSTPLQGAPIEMDILPLEQGDANTTAISPEKPIAIIKAENIAPEEPKPPSDKPKT